MAEGAGFEIEKEELRGVREEADQQADTRNRQLGYCEVITQHVEFHDLAVEAQARRTPSTVVDMLNLWLWRMDGLDPGLFEMTNRRAAVPKVGTQSRLLTTHRHVDHDRTIATLASVDL